MQPNAPPHNLLHFAAKTIARRRFFPLLIILLTRQLRLLLAGVGGILEGAGGLLEDGVLAGVPLGEHPLLLEPGELPPVMDRREHLPHQDQRQSCGGKVVRNSETQSGTVRHGQPQLITAESTVRNRKESVWKMGQRHT